jgi:hypothetical protein
VEALKEKKREERMKLSLPPKLGEKLVWIPIISFRKISFPVAHLKPYYAETGYSRLTLQITFTSKLLSPKPKTYIRRQCKVRDQFNATTLANHCNQPIKANHSYLTGHFGEPATLCIFFGPNLVSRFLIHTDYWFQAITLLSMDLLLMH